MIDVKTLLEWPFEQKTQSYGETDCRRYALSIGLGDDPVDPRQLSFVYEQGLRVFPSFAATLCTPGMWFNNPSTGLVPSKVMHSGQRLSFVREMPVEAHVAARTRVAGVVDQGEGRGCLIHVERDLFVGPDLMATVEDIYFGIRQGGFGGSPQPHRPSRSVPDRPAERVLSLPTRPNAALLYRLNGDRSAFHADPTVARAAGFERPVLHGPCVLAMAVRAVAELWCDLDPSLLRDVEARFSSPHLPGETLRVETWEGEGDIHFRGVSIERGKTVLDAGFASIGRLDKR